MTCRRTIDRRHPAGRRSGIPLALAFLLGLGGIPPASAQPAGSSFTYQGRLAENGTAADGAFDFRFVLYTADVGGSQVGPTLTRDDVPVVDGLFTASLDFGAVAFAGDARFLEIAVRPGASTGAYTILGSRQELKPAPHAIFSQQARDAQLTPWAGVTGKPAGFADDIDNDSGGDVTGVTAGFGLAGGGTSGSVSLSIDTSLTQSRVTGTCPPGSSISSVGQTGTVACESDDNSGGTVTSVTAGTGLTGGTITTSGTVGVNFGTGGVATTVSRGDHNHFGQTWIGGSGAHGLRVENSTGIGVHGIGSPGVIGQSALSGGRAVSGYATGPNGYGVYAESDSGRGVYALATATTGNTVGVLGGTLSTLGTGVHGSAYATTGGASAVVGEGFSSSGIGVRGVAVATTGQNFGVYGHTQSSAGYAGYFSGRAHVSGTLSKGAGSFKIDHPLDPENKYLYHSFVESPDMMNVYNGNVVTDGDGFATVELPEWFEALNRDFRYQVTVVDEADGPGFVQAKVVRKVADNRFSIRTSAPRVEVSWQVTGIRRDPFAEKHRIPVEESKPDDERGTYLHPAAWGAPAEKGLDERRHPPATPLEPASSAAEAAPAAHPNLP